MTSSNSGEVLAKRLVTRGDSGAHDDVGTAERAELPLIDGVEAVRKPVGPTGQTREACRMSRKPGFVRDQLERSLWAFNSPCWTFARPSQLARQLSDSPEVRDGGYKRGPHRASRCLARCSSGARVG